MYDVGVKEKLQRRHRRTFYQQTEDISSAFLHMTSICEKKIEFHNFMRKELAQLNTKQLTQNIF